jgi:hypothetical protein
MALVETVRKLWQRKLLVGLVVVLALFAAIFSAYRVSASPFGIHKRALTVAAASSQILVDSPQSTLVGGASSGTFEALSTRAKIYGQYLSSIAARKRIAEEVGIPPRSLSTSGPFSPATGQYTYEAQSSESRAGELLEEGEQNRLVFTAEEGVPILTVAAQAPTTDRAVALADASFSTLKDYVNALEADGKPVRQGVTVRELGAPEGGMLGGSNNMLLMVVAFLVVFGLGCAAILVVPNFVQRWRALDYVDHAEPGGDPLDPQHPDHGFDAAPPASGETRDPLAPHPAHSR